jgi:hypothetical protein
MVNDSRNRSVITRVNGKAERGVRVNGIQALLFSHVNPHVVLQADAPPVLVQSVDQQARVLACNREQGFFHLPLAVAQP